MIIPNYSCPTCHRKYFDPQFQCIDCGTELGWKCISCNHGNPLIYKYCGKCGVQIPPAISAMILEGNQVRFINIPQFNEAEISELLEEGERLVATKVVKTVTQSDLDKMFE
jgi:hypothetical protein